MNTSFPRELARALVEKYGRMPSAATLARDFNLRSGAPEPITPETARRWIRGLSIPSFERLRVLIDWLEMSPDFFAPNASAEQESSKSANPSQKPRRGAQELLIGGLKTDEAELIGLYRKLSPQQRRLLLSLTHALTGPQG